jgi:hypothetical protein
MLLTIFYCDGIFGCYSRFCCSDATFVVRSFVEEGTSKYVRWCPGAGCTLAVRSMPGYRVYEVTCECKHVFRFQCGEETHQPASCKTAAVCSYGRARTAPTG